MSRVTLLHDLSCAYETERSSKWRKCNDVYKNRGKHRWLEVKEAHNRRVIKRAHRSVGKSNKLRTRRTALGMLRTLNYNDSLAQICRRNREIITGKGTL